MEEKLTYVKEAFARAQKRGLCRSRREFATLLGVNEATISRAFAGNEKYLTDSLVGLIQKWERELDEKPVSVDAVSILLEAVKNMSETIRSQQETIAMLQGLQKKIG